MRQQPQFARLAKHQRVSLTAAHSLCLLLSCSGRTVTTDEPPATGGGGSEHVSTGGQSSTGGQESTEVEGSGGITGGAGGATETQLPAICWDKVDVQTAEGHCPQIDHNFTKYELTDNPLGGGCHSALYSNPVSPPPSEATFEERDPWYSDDPDCHYRECCRHFAVLDGEITCLLAPEGAELCCYQRIYPPPCR